MRKPRRSAAAAAFILPLLLSGCSLLVFTTRKLPVPKPPSMEQTVAPEYLVAQLNQRWNTLSSLTANVEIQASVLKTKQGVAKDYTSISGIILMRKPEMLRVYGRVPVIGNRAFDMVSDGKKFTLWIPSRNKAYKGSNTLKKKSASLMENMRPGFFFDAMAVRGLEPDDLYSVVADSETVEDKARKHLYSVPEYILSISRRKPGSNQLTPVRVITFHREDLMPYQQDIYDSDGNLETQVYYASYQDFGADKYPSWVKIVRPLEDVQVVLTVDKVVENQTLTDDQFVLKLSEGTQIQNLE
jgi:outer membrane lipoprotein-sorting protein